MTRRAGLRPITDVIGTGTENLASLRRLASYLQKIQAVVDSTLPENAIGSVRVADCSDGRLLLIVDNGGWATRLRYQQASITRALAQRLRLGIDRVEVRVRPWPRETATPATPRHLSATSRRLIRDCADYVDNNPELALALDRLASVGGG